MRDEKKLVIKSSSNEVIDSETKAEKNQREC